MAEGKLREKTRTLNGIAYVIKVRTSMPANWGPMPLGVDALPAPREAVSQRQRLQEEAYAPNSMPSLRTAKSVADVMTGSAK